eukprot:7706003-Lingulodinium_polyedra.AAC.1
MLLSGRTAGWLGLPGGRGAGSSNPSSSDGPGGPGSGSGSSGPRRSRALACSGRWAGGRA